MPSPYTAVIYRVTLVRVPDNEPLKGCSYFGQSVRIGTPEQVAHARWLFEKWDAQRMERKIGFLAILRKYGPTAFDWDILEHCTMPHEDAQAWADKQETYHIAANGGVLVDSTKKMWQTLNQTRGGKGSHFESFNASARRIFDEFKRHMVEYVEEFKTSRVPQAFVCSDGHGLGGQLAHVRRGGLWAGRSFEQEAKTWLLGLPDFSFDRRDTSYESFKLRLCEYIQVYEDANVPTDFVTADGYRLGKQLSNVRSGTYLKGSHAEERRAYFSSLPGFVWWANGTERERQLQSAAAKKRHKDPVYKANCLSVLWEGREASKPKRRKEYVLNAVQSAQPYEPVMKKRVFGSFYHLPDGSIARCESNLRWSRQRATPQEIRSVGEM